MAVLTPNGLDQHPVDSLVPNGITRVDKAKTLSSIDTRLTKIEGQLRGIRGMAAEGRACVDVVAQIAAVRGALKKVADLLVAEHVEEWLRNAQNRTDSGAPPDVEELIRVFNQYYR